MTWNHIVPLPENIDQMVTEEEIDLSDIGLDHTEVNF